MSRSESEYSHLAIWYLDSASAQSRETDIPFDLYWGSRYDYSNSYLLEVSGTLVSQPLNLCEPNAFHICQMIYVPKQVPKISIGNICATISS